MLLLGMCRIDFLFPFGFLKKLDSVWNKFCLVRLKKHRLVWILYLLSTHVIADITATVDDMTLPSLTSLTTMTTSK